jgi:hypothetical protein
VTTRPPARAGAGLERSHEVDDLDRLRSFVDEIARDDEDRVPAGPTLRVIDEMVRGEEAHERVVMAVDVADGVHVVGLVDLDDRRMRPPIPRRRRERARQVSRVRRLVGRRRARDEEGRSDERELLHGDAAGSDASQIDVS